MEGRCAVCVSAARQAFPQHSWEVILAKAKTNPTFAAELSTAIRAKAGGTAAGCPEDVRSCWTLGYSIEKDFALYTEKEFLESFGLKPSDAGLVLESFKDENGADIMGVALSDCKTQRRIKLHSYVDLSHAEWIHHRHQQLRDGQGMDAMMMWRDDLRKTRGKTLRGVAPPSVEEATQMVANKKEQVRAEEEERQRMAALAAEAGIETENKEEEEEDVVEEIVPLINIFDNPDGNDDGEFQEFEGAKVTKMLLPSQRAELQKSARGKGQKAKGKGRGKASKAKAQPKTKAGKRKGHSDENMSAPSGTASVGVPALRLPSLHASQPSGQSSAPSVAAQGGQSSSGSDGDAASVFTVAASLSKKGSSSLVEKHINLVDLAKILAGEQLGDKLYQCKRAMQSIEAKDGECSELITLRGHYLLAMRCQEMCVQA